MATSVMMKRGETSFTLWAGEELRPVSFDLYRQDSVNLGVASEGIGFDELWSIRRKYPEHTDCDYTAL